MTTPTDHSDIDERANKAAARQARAASAAKRRKRIERAGYNVSEFSASLGIDDSTTFRWIKKGVVRAIQIGGLISLPPPSATACWPRARRRGGGGRPGRRADSSPRGPDGGAVR